MTRQVTIISLIGAALILFLSPFNDTNILEAQEKQSSAKTSRKSMIGNIKDKSILDGCGCYFSHPPEEKKRFPRYVFFSDLDEKNAWMNIDGRDVKLRLTHSTQPKIERIGSRITRTYVAAGIKVSVVYITTRLCKPNDENCESTDYDATITVVKGGRRQAVKLKGGCGC